MTAEVQSPFPATLVIHSQIVLPRREVWPPPLVEDCEGLWDKVHRICDQYMPRLREAWHPFGFEALSCRGSVLRND